MSDRMAMTLNHKVSLEARQSVGDNAGGFSESWVALGTLWARIAPRSGRVINGETGAVSNMSFDVWVRGAPVGHTSRPVAGQRFALGSRRLLIEAVTEEEPRGSYLQCVCSEEVAT